MKAEEAARPLFLAKSEKVTHNILWLRDKCKQSRIVYILFVTKFLFFSEKKLPSPVLSAPMAES